MLSACKKSNSTSDSALYPSDIKIINGNWQLGNANIVLPDTIVIAITPKKIGDAKYYSYYFDSRFGSNGTITSFDTIIGGIYYIKAVWQLSNSNLPQTTTLYLFGNCNSPYFNNCKPIDSITISTRMSQEWIQVFANDPSTGGPGYFSDIHFNSTNSGIIVGSYYKSGMLQTSDSGNTWQTLTSPRNDYYIASFSNTDTGLLIVTNNYAYFTDDGGKTVYQPVSWTPPFVGDMSSSDYFMQNRNIIYSVGRQGGIAKTVDAGQTWSIYNGFNSINWLYSITCTDPNNCYACGEVGRVIKTNDAGITWTGYTAMFNFNLRKIYFWDKNTGLAGGEHGALLRTIDGGNNWTIVKTNLAGTIVCIQFFSADTGYIVTSNGDIAKTMDGGWTWSILAYGNLGYFQGYNKIIFRDSKVLFALAGQSIYKFSLP
jgi:photosystem II stability/assembly factor-like uncharacterized protein